MRMGRAGMLPFLEVLAPTVSELTRHVSIMTTRFKHMYDRSVSVLNDTEKVTLYSS
jgi:hypothetical protein